MKPLHDLTAAEASTLLRAAAITSAQLVEALLDRIAAEEPRVDAWQFLDPELALAQARSADATWPPGLPRRPPLAGVPVGVKDIIDTAEMPTQCGSPIHRGRRPAADAACVAALRREGAVVLGKTVTTEFALFTPGKTRNPRHPRHTPGGSSSGSAAAVAARMVPLALGSQTAGSVIRPASFCGVLGFKPTHGLLPLDGVQPQAPSLDTLGFFARSADDLALLLDALDPAGAGADGLRGPAPAGASGEPAGAPSGAAGGSSAAPAPRIAVCRTEAWPLVDDDGRRVLDEAAARFAAAGAAVVEVELGPGFAGLAEAQRTIQAYEAARSLARERAGHADLLSPSLTAILDEGAAIPDHRYRAAVALAAACRAALPPVFARADALLTPSTRGAAPAGLDSTGDPALNRIWTALHVPCVNLPAGVAANGLPIGVQLVGPPAGDRPLLRLLSWAADSAGTRI